MAAISTSSAVRGTGHHYSVKHPVDCDPVTVQGVWHSDGQDSSFKWDFSWMRLHLLRGHDYAG